MLLPSISYHPFCFIVLLLVSGTSSFSPRQPGVCRSHATAARRAPSPTLLFANHADDEQQPDDVNTGNASTDADADTEGVTPLERARIIAYRAGLVASALAMSLQAIGDVAFLEGTGVDLGGLVLEQSTTTLPLASGVTLLLCPVPRNAKLGALSLGTLTVGCGAYAGAVGAGGPASLSWSLAVVTLMAISLREIWYFGGAFKIECGVTLFTLPLMLDWHHRVPLTFPGCALGLSVLAAGKIFEPCREDLIRSNSEFLAK